MRSKTDRLFLSQTARISLTSWVSRSLAVMLLAGISFLAQAQEHPTLEFSKWSGSINVPDPVAVSVDDQGRVYATQTRRRKIQDLDIRQHSEWIPNDLSLTSIDEKKEFFHRVLAVGGDQDKQQRHVEDWNEDGQYDWRDLTVVSEVIYRLVDEDGDEKADEMTVFADDFRTEVTGVAAGVLAFDGTVYATIAPDVWKLYDSDGDGKSDSREVLAHGFGLHIAYGGHDMHGLTIGPDGKVYWSIGDKGIHVTSPEGKEFFYPHEGGVLRCNPDGSDFEVFAHGLRNVQEVAFDQYGNMFGVDNDSDQPNEKERFVYIVNQMDAGWRNFYQYRQSKYNPWTDEHLWDMPGDDHPAFIVPPLSHYIDGPAGFKFNPGTALSEDYADYFFLTGAPNGTQHAFRIVADGDSFRMEDEHQIGNGIAIVGLAFGPDGALYGADWDGGYPLDEKGSVIRIDVSKDQRSSIRLAVQKLLGEGLAKQTDSELLNLLGHQDQRIRLRAQFELVARDRGLSLAAIAKNDRAEQLSRLHALWGLGQLGRQGDTLARDTIVQLFSATDPILRGQAAKTYGELRDVRGDPLLSILEDDSEYVRVLAALALARQPREDATPKLLELTTALESSQHYLRHAYATALAACATEEDLVGQASNESESRRICCVLALRKQDSEGVAQYLDDSSTWVASEAARAIHDDWSIASALNQLAKSLVNHKDAPTPFVLRAINASFRLGSQSDFDFLVQQLQSQPPKPTAVAILEALAEWREPSPLDRVQGIYRKELASQAERTPDTMRLPQILEAIIDGPDAELRTKAFQVANALDVKFSKEGLIAMARNENLEVSARILALQLLAEDAPEVIEEAWDSPSSQIRMAALRLASEAQAPAAIQRIVAMLESEDASESARQAGIQILKAMDHPDAATALVEFGKEFLEEQLPLELALDVIEAIQQNGSRDPDFLNLRTEVQSKLQNAPLGLFQYAKVGGSAENGKKLFETHGQAQCARCHRVGRRGSEIGPPLGEIARKRDRDYLWRAIVTPSVDIEDKYKTQSILLDSDEVLLGRIQQERDDYTVVADTKGELREILTDDIIETKTQDTSLMPDMREVLTAREVRDLVAYLQTLK